MTEILPYATPEQPLRGKPLPQWAWLLGILTFPIGAFIALAAAKLISWRRGITLAVISYASCAAVIGFLPWLQDWHPAIFHVVEPLFMMMILAWAAVFYRIGKNARYWSQRTRTWCIVLFWVVFSLALAELAIVPIFHRWLP